MSFGDENNHMSGYIYGWQEELGYEGEVEMMWRKDIEKRKGDWIKRAKKFIKNHC